MADLKPLGSEKLHGQDKIKRIMEIARYKETTPLNINESSKSEFDILLSDGKNYQIVKERQGYIIKKTISESKTEYIEPMKNRKYYSSYSQALKRLNLLTKEINRLTENEEGTSLFGEQKKFVLKTPKPINTGEDLSATAPPPAAPPPVPEPALPPSPDAMPSGDMGGSIPPPTDDMGSAVAPPPTDDMGGTEAPAPEDMGGDEAPAPEDMGGDEAPAPEEMGGGEEKVTFKTIQKLTGKLTQKIRSLDSEQGMTSENMKYVINMVLSSLDLKNLSEEDKEDIMSKFDEESEDMSADDMGGTDFTDDTEVEDIQSDMDTEVEQGSQMQAEPEMTESGHGALMDSIFKESKVDRVISKYFEMTKRELLEQRNQIVERKKEKQKLLKRKMSSVSKMCETIEQELASQKYLEENLNFEFIGKTNKRNLVFENSRGKRVKISPEGLVV